MSLLGSLEDLSLPDIVQIVYLSRRTGILEVIDGDARWAVYFRQGLIVGASSPATGDDLAAWLEEKQLISKDQAAEVSSEPVVADALITRGSVSKELLAGSMRQRIIEVAAELREKKSGEFNFILSDDLSDADLGYDPETLLEGGGIAPEEAMASGEAMKPLQGLEESLRAGKALLRGDAEPDEASGFGFGKEIAEISRESREVPIPESLTDFEEDEPAAEEDEPAAEEEEPAAEEEEPAAEEEGPFDLDETTVTEPEREPEPAESPFADLSEQAPAPAPEKEEVSFPEPPSPLEEPVPAAPLSTDHEVTAEKASSRVRIEAGNEVEESDRNVVIFEKDPLVRVAAKRAFGKTPFSLYQYGAANEARDKIEELLNASRFFVTFLNVDQEGESALLLNLIKRRNRHLPVVIVDDEADLERRHDLLQDGANLYLTKPSPAHLLPSIADASLSRFADELVGFVDKSASEWLDLTRTLQSEDKEVGEAFYEIAEKERIRRSRELIRYLIDELTDPDDISQVVDTVLRMAEEYLDRAVLFVASQTRFIALGGFGLTGTKQKMNELISRIWIPRDAESILRTVAESGKTHRGKMRRTEANAKLVEGMGTLVPTEVIVIPLQHDGVTEGVLFGDNGAQHIAIGDTRALELFLHESGLAFRNAVATNAEKKGIDWEN